MQSTESDYNNGQMNKPTNNSYGCSAARLLALLTALFIGNVNYAQGFEFAFGGPKEDQGVAIVQTADHGFLEVGFSEGILGDDNDIDIYVVRTDVDGTTLWERSYDEGFEEFPTEIVSNNGNFLISGHRRELFNSPSKGYLICINEFGTMLWSQTYGSADGAQKINHILATPDGSFLLTGTFTDALTDKQDILLLKVDQYGEEIWRQLIGSNRDEEGIAAVMGPENNGFVIGANGKSSALIDNDIFFYGVDNEGNFDWSRSYGEPNIGEQLDDLIPTSDGNMAFVGSVNNSNTALIAKANLNGDTLWYKEVIATPFDNLLHGVIEEEGGDVLVAAGEATPDDASFNIDILMVKVNSETGDLIYQRLIGDDNVLNTAADLAPTVKGGYALAAFNALANVSFNDMTLYKTDSEGEHLTNHIRGRVFHSTDGCNPFTAGDQGLEGWLVRAESESSIFFSSTDSLGFYDLQVDVDNYTVSLLQKNDRWDICNPVALIVDFGETYDSTRHNFPLTPALDCPLLEVELSAGPAMSCEDQIITVSYGNQGTVTAQAVSVTIELDEILSYSSSSIELSNQDGQLLTFELPDLMIGQQGSFEITVAVGCAGVQNQQAVSTTAMISPVSDCSPIDPEWDQSSIEVNGRCDGDSIRFQIRNVSPQPTSTLNYIVVEDQVMIRSVPFDLPGLGELAVNYASEDADGSTYRLIAQQSPGHPGNLFPTAVVEGCTEDGTIEFTTGQVAQFADNDGDLNIDILTQEVFVLNSSEPLVLRAYPKGYQDSIITPNTSLEYTIFFSLDSTDDTIGRVVIRDTLSSLLDLNSLEMGAASHPYDFTLYQNGVLKITFDSIQLHAGGGTGGAGNTSQQQGYLSFRLSQKPNNAVGVVISNRAAVYFDYRTPQLSNSVRHVVSCQELFTSNCLLTSSVNYPELSGVNINVYPNPLNTVTTVKVEGWNDSDTDFEFRLFDLLGRQVYKKNFSGDQTQIQRHNLPVATYYYELWGDGLPIGKGNLFVQ